jgi:uncharacterized protein YbjQ (UPF0145 family)
MQRILSLTVLVGLVLAPLAATARETEHLFDVNEAKTSPLGQERLFAVPFYMKGQKHPAVSKVVATSTTEQSTRGALRSDSESCQVAFLSAVRELQKRAQDRGADAVIDIVSVTWNKETSSASEYRCVAGTWVVHVGLKGKLVKLKK